MVEIKVGRDAKFIYVQIENTNFVAYGDTIKEAFCRLGEQIEVAYDTYAQELDDNLTETAIRLKKWLLRNFKEVIEDGN